MESLVATVWTEKFDGQCFIDIRDDSLQICIHVPEINKYGDVIGTIGNAMIAADVDTFENFMYWIGMGIREGMYDIEEAAMREDHIRDALKVKTYRWDL